MSGSTFTLFVRCGIWYADGSYFITIKELPGCMSSGDTQEEALRMIEDAMRAWITAALEEGKRIPLPDATDNEEYSRKFVLRIPKILTSRFGQKSQGRAGEPQPVRDVSFE